MSKRKLANAYEDSLRHYTGTDRLLTMCVTAVYVTVSGVHKLLTAVADAI